MRRRPGISARLPVPDLDDPMVVLPYADSEVPDAAQRFQRALADPGPPTGSSAETSGDESFTTAPTKISEVFYVAVSKIR